MTATAGPDEVRPMVEVDQLGKPEWSITLGENTGLNRKPTATPWGQHANKGKDPQNRKTNAEVNRKHLKPPLERKTQHTEAKQEAAGREK